MKNIILIFTAFIASIFVLFAQPTEFDFTPNNMAHGLIATVTVNGIVASANDWIAAFDEDNNCAGAVQLLDYYGQAFCNLRVYGNDVTTTNIDEGMDGGETFTFKLWVAATNQILGHPIDIPPVAGWDAGWGGAPIPGYGFSDDVVLDFTRAVTDTIIGCTDPTACNYNAAATENDNNCLYLDCKGVCGGTAVIGTDCQYAQPAEFDFTPNNTANGVIATVTVNGIVASANDWIAAFDEDNNCAGAVQLLDYYGQAFCNLQVYGNDFTTTNIDEGMDGGETFTFKLWVAATNQILGHPIDIPPVAGWDAGWGGAPIPGYGFSDDVVLDFTRAVTDTIIGCTDPTACNYNAAATENDNNCLYLDCKGVCGGTAVIGTDCQYAQPAEFDFTPNSYSSGIIATVTVNGIVASANDWIAAFDEDNNCAGAVQLLDYYDQAYCNLQVYANDFTTDDIDEGMDAGETFTFKLWVAATNEILEHPTDIPPIAGWDASLGGTPIPGYGFADGAVLNFTRAVTDTIIGCTDPTACNYNAAATENDNNCLYLDCKGVCGGTAVDADCDYAQPTEFDFTPNNISNGVIATVTVNGIVASANDYIAAFDEDNNCAGAVQLLDYYGQAFCNLQVYGNDITTTNIDEGMDGGETFTFKLWVAATNQILGHPIDIPSVAGWYAGLEGAVVPGYDFADSAVLDFTRATEITGIIQIDRSEFKSTITALYPLPATDLIILQYVASEQSDVVVEIYDLSGRTLKTFQHNVLSRNINLLNINVEDLAAGVYIIAINTDTESVTRKFVVK